MKKNVASQVIGVQMVSATDGSAFTSTVSCSVTGDGGTQGAGGGTVTHEGNGFHTYTPTQAETNYDHIGFTFTGTGAVPKTVQVYTTYPQTGDNYARLGAPAGASIAADIATVDTVVDGIAAALPTNFSDLAITATTGLVDVNDKTGYSISGTLTTLDQLDTAQDTQHSTTQGLITTIDTVVDAILVDTGTTLPATLTTIEGKIDTVDTVVDAVLVDTGTTIPAQLDSMSGATFDTATDSLEAIRNRGDAAWTTGAGGTPPQLLQNTTIATLASQTSFTLTAGSADDDAYNGAVVVVTDSVTSTQKCVGSVSDYVGSTKTVTLSADPGVFTMAAGDTIDIIANASTAPSAAAVRAEIDANSTQLAAIVADTNELQGDWANGGRLDLLIDAIKAVTDALPNSGALTDLATQASVNTVDTNVDAILVDTGTTLPGLITTIDTVVDAIKLVTDALPDSGALTSIATAANLATVDTVVDAIKVKTDQLTFSVANQVDANTESINGTAVTGSGTAGDPWT